MTKLGSAVRQSTTNLKGSSVSHFPLSACAAACEAGRAPRLSSCLQSFESFISVLLGDISVHRDVFSSG
jgi:hypothetical protein